MTLVIRNDLIHRNAWVMHLFRKRIIPLWRKDALMAGLISIWLVAYGIGCWFNSQLIHRQILILCKPLKQSVFSFPFLSVRWCCALSPLPSSLLPFYSPVLQLILFTFCLSPSEVRLVQLGSCNGVKSVWKESWEGISIFQSNIVIAVLCVVTWITYISSLWGQSSCGWGDASKCPKSLEFLHSQKYCDGSTRKCIPGFKIDCSYRLTHWLQVPAACGKSIVVLSQKEFFYIQHIWKLSFWKQLKKGRTTWFTQDLRADRVNLNCQSCWVNI